MAIEIEVKARIKDRAALVEKLAAMSCILSEPVVQDDTVYVENVGSLNLFMVNKVFLRIRIIDDAKVILTAKQSKDKAARNLIKLEHEVSVDSAEEARAMLIMMGYREAVHVRKSRQVATYGNYEICIDEIDDLGSFIEVEAMGDESRALEIQDKLWQFLHSLDISPRDKITKGYDILMLEQNSRR
jgi:adenylate cyclase, class 2